MSITLQRTRRETKFPNKTSVPESIGPSTYQAVTCEPIDLRQK